MPNVFSFRLNEGSPAAGPVTTVTLAVTWPHTCTAAYLKFDLAHDPIQLTHAVDLVEGFVLGAAEVPPDPAALDFSIGYGYGYRSGRRARRDSEKGTK
jgi:hypothetical protein